MGRVPPWQEKTAVCTANDLNYCLHQNQTKKNINFLEKRESPKRTFSFLYKEKTAQKAGDPIPKNIGIEKRIG